MGFPPDRATPVHAGAQLARRVVELNLGLQGARERVERDRLKLPVGDVDRGAPGKAADAALSKAHITVNKNAVPNYPQSPFVTSGIRVGTPAPTTRGFKEAEMTEIANLMCDVMENIDDEDVIAIVREKVGNLCARFPVYS